MTVKGIARLAKIMFPKYVSETSGGFTIASFIPVEITEGNIELNDTYGTFTVKGELPPLKEGVNYSFVVEEGERHKQYGLSYNNVFMRQDVELDTDDVKSVKSFLKIILTKRQVDALYEVTDNPIKAIENRDYDTLTKAKGIGKRTADRIINHYESQKDYSFAYIELGKHDIPPKVIKRIVDYYGSPELAVQKVEENPYQLSLMEGYGFKKCDALFLKLGGLENSEIRIKAFINFVLDEEAGNGNTWISTIELIDKVVELVPKVEKTTVAKLLLNNEEIYLTDDKKRVSLEIYQKLESLVATQLIRLLNAESKIEYDGWEEYVANVEKEQGWEFTCQQKEAIEMMLSNNVFLLQGLGGTGKSSSMKAVVDILENKGYLYAQTALSGKASNNLTLVTGKEGSTIHRLLCYQPDSNSFAYNSKNPLPFDIIIVDEISMVDARLFAHLLSAIRDGAKLIMLGDSQQLESIGIPVMLPMIKSGVIPTMTLTQIHRQAQKSAIVTDSIKVREGKNVIGANEKGRVIHGELQDLEYEIIEDYGDSSSINRNILINTMREFKKHIEVEDIMDIQILTQTRDKGTISCLALNRMCQKVYNPSDISKKEVQLGNESKGTDYILREGDKVINVRNNYGAEDEFGNSSPVFNGNIGIIKEIGYDNEDEEEDMYMIIDFEGIGRIKIYKEDFGSIELAYAITVHKSQGSASKVVIVALPFHYMLNTRQLFYTAITRARQRCIVVSTAKSIISAIRKDDVSKKQTYLAEYLVNLSSKEVS